MIYQSPDNPFSHLTAKKRTTPSYPLRQLLARKLLHGRVLDFGSGHGTDVAYLQAHGIAAETFDPYYAPEFPIGKFDTILCTYVLNVLLPLEQTHVLMCISELLNPWGNVYFTVRRDVVSSGFRTHAIYKEEVYQCNVVLPFPTLMSTNHCEIYHYRHINQLGPVDDDECKFCHPDHTVALITESATTYAIYSHEPSTPGHAIVVPKPHIAQFFELPERNKTACWLMVDRVRAILEHTYKPLGFTVQFELNASDFSRVSHVHIHIVPKYSSDGYSW